MEQNSNQKDEKVVQEGPLVTISIKDIPAIGELEVEFFGKNKFDN